MPIPLSYPGIYTQTKKSDVRTITGVSTSVTAFVGIAKRGPIDAATRIQSFKEYEVVFGGLHRDSEMSYAVRQFFLNGGSEAWVVRVADKANSAKKILQRGGIDVLEVEAVEKGEIGNAVDVVVDYRTSNPDQLRNSNFNLTVRYTPADGQGEIEVERFENLSMNSYDPRFVENIVNGSSRLVTVEKIETAVDRQGKSTSGLLPPLSSGSVTSNRNQFSISIDGGPARTIILNGDDLASAPALAAAISGQIGTAATVHTIDEESRLEITSATQGEASSVHVTQGQISDIAALLRLGPLNGGEEIDAAEAIRPSQSENRGRLVLNGVTEPILNGPLTFKIALNGGHARTVSIDAKPAGFTQIRAERLKVIERAIRNLNYGQEEYRYFEIEDGAADSNSITLKSGTFGNGSSVQVFPSTGGSFPSGLTVGAATSGTNELLVRVSEVSVSDALIAYTETDKGIHALDKVDLFNILCLPGVSQGGKIIGSSTFTEEVASGILQQAAQYCKERRAFLIVDAPQTNGIGTSEVAPNAMVDATVNSTVFPKSENAAVYYPWIQIPDPLSGGKLRSTAPCGTIAGIYARTDSGPGIWKAPAGTEASLTNVLKVGYKMNDRENGILNPIGVNCIRQFPVYGNVVWGARTLRGNDEMADEYKYVPVRRTALFIEESLFRGLKWVVFMPNDEPLWAQIRLNVGAFMHNLFRQGAFQGKTPREAYLVKCDKETTTQNDIDRGIVNIVVGFAPLKPAEFVVVTLQQMAGQIQM